MLSQDLMVRSRVAATLAVGGIKLEVLTLDSKPVALDLLLADLNRGADERLAWLERVQARGAAGEVICFGRHTEMAELNPRALAAGAARCVANSHLPVTLGRWLRSRPGGRDSPRRGTA